MIENQMINMLIAAENVIGVYRNYISLKKSRKVLALMRIVLEILLSTVALAHSTYVVEMRSRKNPPCLLLIIHLMNYFSSVIIAICSIKNSRSYKMFITDFMAVHHSFQKEPMYIKCLRKLKLIFIITTLLCCITNMVLFTTKILHKSVVRGRQLDVGFVVLVILEILVEIRFTLEHTILYIFITMLEYLLKCFNNYIVDIQKKYNNLEMRLYINRRQKKNLLTVNKIEEWATKYQRLVSCSKKLSACFRIQVNYICNVALSTYQQ